MNQRNKNVQLSVVLIQCMQKGKTELKVRR